MYTKLDSSEPDKYMDPETASDEFELVVLCSVNKSLESLPFNNITLVGNKSDELLKEEIIKNIKEFGDIAEIENLSFRATDESFERYREIISKSR